METAGQMETQNIFGFILLFAIGIGIPAAYAAPCDTLQIPTVQEKRGDQDGLQFTKTAEYRKQFSAATTSAKKYCQQYLKEHSDSKNLAVVSDIDETILDNREEFQVHPKFEWNNFEKWIDQARAPLLPKTAEFLKWARMKGIAVFLCTGRPEKTRRFTIENLVRDHVSFDGLYLRADNEIGQPAAVYKSGVRKRIEDMGFTVVVNIGDQWSDLSGGHALDCEKLPNEIYFIR